MPWGDLHTAALEDNAELAEALLLSAAARVDTRSDDGGTPLMVAAQGGHERVARALLHFGADVNIASESGWTALMMSAQNGHLAVAALLAGAGAEVDAEDCEGDTALTAASSNGHAAVVDLLVGAGADLECACFQDAKRPLHKAAQGGHLAVVGALVAAGADPECRTVVGETPLLLAALHGHLGVVRALLRARVDPAYPMILPTGKQFVALDAAADQGHRETVRELLALGVDACGGPRRGVVGLCLAAQKEDVGMIAILREGGVVDTGKALCDATNQGREASVKFLLRLDWGVPARRYVNVRNDLGFTPLWIAVGSGTPRIVRMLLDAGADVKKTCRNTNLWQFEGSRVTPLGFVMDSIRQRNYRGGFATEEQVERMQAVRRLLLRVDAVRALSWLWRRSDNASGTARSAEEEVMDGDYPGRSAAAAAAALKVPIVRDRKRAATAAFFRYSNKP